MLAELAAGAGIAGRAYRKTGEPLLWMEVYTAIADPDALVDRLDRLAARHGLDACLAENQRRHVETRAAGPAMNANPDSRPEARHLRIALIAHQAHPVYALIIAANRDEFHARARRPPRIGGRKMCWQAGIWSPAGPGSASRRGAASRS